MESKHKSDLLLFVRLCSRPSGGLEEKGVLFETHARRWCIISIFLERLRLFFLGGVSLYRLNAVVMQHTFDVLRL